MKRLLSATLVIIMMTLLLISGCAGEETQTTTPPSTTPPTTTPPTTSPPTTSPDEPKYGGMINVVKPLNIAAFDTGASGYTGIVGVGSLHLTNENLLGGDWSRGPAGTNEIDHMISGYHGIEYFRGVLADEWEFPEIGRMIYHIRPGVHWALNPDSEASKLMNGREFTVDDVVWNIERYTTDNMSAMRSSEAHLADGTHVRKLDEETVEITTEYDPWTGFLFMAAGVRMFYMPREVVEEYGNMLDWRNSVGTGPFMLTDFVDGASATFLKNPDYWDKDPVGPGEGNQLPYVDGINYLIVPDYSTRLAALRSANADWMNGITWEDAESLQNTNPELESKRYLPDVPYTISMRTDKPELPFHELKVRQALTLATDWESLKTDLYGGQAEYNIFPIGPFKGFEDAYMGLEEAPASVKELYSYNPEKARQLLEEAGYPEGFETTITCIAPQTDYLSVITAMWADIGVEVQLDPREESVYTAMRRNYDEMKTCRHVGVATFANMVNLRYVTMYSWVDDDPVVDATYKEIQKNIIIREKEAMRLHKELMPYVYEQCWQLPIPTQYSYTFWQPWVKNYHGELNINYVSIDNSWMTWVWLDQDMKKEMTGQ